MIIVFLILVLISTLWPRYEERFFEFGLLGKEKRAEGYFPTDDFTIKIGSQINWFIYIHNHMGSFQNVIVRVKLLNSTMQVPDDNENHPSPIVHFAEIPLYLSVDDTHYLPFTWSILEANVQNETIILESLEVNNQTVIVHVPTSSNSFFRMVFELWIYDQASQQYIFGWETGKDFSSSSLRMAFRATLSNDEL